MGNGTRSGQLLNFQVTANYDLSATDQGLWQRAFTKASEILWNASQGQLRLGTVWVADANAGANDAEFILDPSVSGRALGTFGQWGTSGRSIFLPAYAQSQVLTILHEMGHHVWGLREEYARSEGMGLDKTTALPAGHGNLIIPLTTSAGDEPDGNYAGADVILKFPGQPVETRQIQSKVGNRITVATPFSQNPQNCEWSGVTVQWTAGVECTGDRGTGACIMEFSRGSAGTLAADGTWTPAAQPVTEYCTPTNHDPDADTDQESDLGQACWESIAAKSGFTDLAQPAGAASTVAPGGWSAPNWVILDPNIRLALVLDRSGSMNGNSGARLAGVKTGARFWIENAAVEDDQLTIVWYANSASVQLPLVGFGSLTGTQVGAELATITAQTAGGGTDIVEGLQSGLAQLTSPANPASVQATVLITDGAHNAAGAMADQVAPYRAANTNIYTLGVGQGGEMDLPGLADLAIRTGGTHQTAGDGSDAAAIQAAMIQINALVRGGMVSGSGPDSPDLREVDDQLRAAVKEFGHDKPEGRPTLEELSDRFGVLPLKDAMAGKGPHRYTWIPLEVEKGATSTTFTLSHDRAGSYWMFLIDPAGNEVRPGSPEVIAWNSTAEPYEFAKIDRPMMGQWLVVGLRLDTGVPLTCSAIAAINHPEISVHGGARLPSVKGPVELYAGGRFVEPLTELMVTARVQRDGGPWVTTALRDRLDDGDYRAWVSLPTGTYRGYIEVRSPDRPLVANPMHAVLHVKDLDEFGDGRADAPAFVRQVPIAFTIGRRKDPTGIVGEDEQKPDKGTLRRPGKGLVWRNPVRRRTVSGRGRPD